MSFKYLDNNGLQYFWNKIVAKINDAKGVTAVNPTTPVDATIIIPTKTSELINDSGFIDGTSLNSKQDTLVSGTNIKTINNTSLLGSGNISVATSSDLASYVPKIGTTLTGALIAQNNTNYTTAQVRNVTFSTSEPTSSQGGNGDIWIVYS